MKRRRDTCTHVPDDGLCTDGNACTDDTCGEIGVFGLEDIVGNDATGVCVAGDSLTGGFVSGTGGVVWTHDFTPPAQPIFGATLTVDMGDADGNTLTLISDDSGLEIGTITGGDNGGPGSWHCYDAWVGGQDNVLVIPPAVLPDLADGSFTVSTANDTGVGSWGSNRAKLTIDVVGYQCSSTPTDCDDGGSVHHRRL